MFDFLDICQKIKKVLLVIEWREILLMSCVFFAFPPIVRWRRNTNSLSA